LSENLNEKDETPFSLYLTGRMQFFPQPISTVMNSIRQLKKANHLLEETIRNIDNGTDYQPN